jgi:phage pi2 protein 07/5S rRNA maturation endonuclease (ribonuclease M5)
MDAELERIKSEINLTEYLAWKGFKVDKNKSTRASILMRKGSERIIVARAEDNHWIYFSVHDEQDSGSIIDFIQRRDGKNLGQVRASLRPWFGFQKRPKVDPSNYIYTKNVAKSFSDQAKVTAKYELLRELKKENDNAVEYLSSRKIGFDLLFHPKIKGSIKADFYSNCCFLHYYRKDVVGWEMKSKEMNGYTKYGQKSVWYSNPLKTESQLVLFESAIDALSWQEIFPDKIEVSWLWSTGGGWSKNTKNMIEVALKKYQHLEVICAFDNDSAGDDFYRKICEMMEKEVFRYKPNLKDWNDDLKSIKK